MVINKRLLILAGTVLLSLAACKEKGPDIQLGKAVIVDSTYTAPVEAAQKHYVLVEEFTGATCTNCPKARDLLHSISVANDERLIVMGIHPFGIGQATPVHDSKHDFRTEKGTSIKNTYFGDLAGIPAGGFDRMKFGGGSALLTPKWPNAIQERLAVPTPVNVYITSTYDEATKKANIEVKIALTADLSEAPKLSIVVIEDSLIDAQEFPGAEVDHDYVFMHTFRDYITAINGDAVVTTGATLEPGRVFIREYKNVDINPDWVVKHCKLIVFVHYDNGTNTEVLQAAEVHLAE